VSSGVRIGEYTLSERYDMANEDEYKYAVTNRSKVLDLSYLKEIER